MSAITLPCGCRLNRAFVLALCLTHDHELRAKEIENEKAFKEYERLMQSAEHPTGEQK